MKYCSKCQKMVNTIKRTFDIGIAEAQQEHCESCGNFINSEVTKVYDLVFDLEKNKVSIKDEEDK